MLRLHLIGFHYFSQDNLLHYHLLKHCNQHQPNMKTASEYPTYFQLDSQISFQEALANDMSGNHS